MRGDGAEGGGAEGADRAEGGERGLRRKLRGGGRGECARGFDEYATQRPPPPAVASFSCLR